jgi:hypothetical protein
VFNYNLYRDLFFPGHTMVRTFAETWASSFGFYYPCNDVLLFARLTSFDRGTLSQPPPNATIDGTACCKVLRVLER